IKLDEASPEKSARRGDAESDGADKSALGVTVSPLTPDVASRMGASKDVHGVVVESVSPDGRAADAGIQAGDIIQEVNRQAVTSVEDLRTAIQKMTDRPMLVLINRNGNSIFVTVPRANG